MRIEIAVKKKKVSRFSITNLILVSKNECRAIAARNGSSEGIKIAHWVVHSDYENDIVHICWYRRNENMPFLPCEIA